MQDELERRRACRRPRARPRRAHGPTARGRSRVPCVIRVSSDSTTRVEVADCHSAGEAVVRWRPIRSHELARLVSEACPCALGLAIEVDGAARRRGARLRAPAAVGAAGSGGRTSSRDAKRRLAARVRASVSGTVAAILPLRRAGGRSGVAAAIRSAQALRPGVRGPTPRQHERVDPNREAPRARAGTRARTRRPSVGHGRGAGSRGRDTAS